MNIVKLILGVIGVFIIGFAALWLLGFLSSILWYAFWIALIGGVGYGVYKLFLKVESKALGSDPYGSIGSGDIQMSWDEYDKKYKSRN